MTIAPSKNKHPNAELEVFAAKMFQKGELTGGYYGPLVYHNKSSPQDTREVYGDGVLKVDDARISKYALQLKV